MIKHWKPEAVFFRKETVYIVKFCVPFVSERRYFIQTRRRKLIMLEYLLMNLITVVMRNVMRNNRNEESW